MVVRLVGNLAEATAAMKAVQRVSMSVVAMAVRWVDCSVVQMEHMRVELKVV